MTETPAPATLPKTFDPATIEARWAAHWEANGLFRPHRPDAAPYTIVNPPPNVTGALHIGHALDNTLQDVLIRYERLRGKDALWVVGTDHAGIATQMVVERQMAEAQDKRTNYSREDFIAKVWEWKAESGGEITRQLRRLGCSMDWSREQFTMDPHFTTAVTKVFVQLYEEGLLYRDKRLVNWDPGLKTAISDLEVETREVNGKFWHFKYPLEDGSGHISVATTRPETMLADMAVAVNASDARYASVIGKHVLLPITGRRVPIIADDHADPELGSGAVKITPGHDFNDFEVGKRAGIAPAQMLNMLDAEARVVQTSDGLIPDNLLGLEGHVARTRVVERMDDLGLLALAEDRIVNTPYGDRSGQVIEPWLTDQWYVDAKTLAQPAIEAVKSGAIEIVPKSWEKTFFNWMDNIQPWCVSRQLWWGHRIPVWYGPKIKGTELSYDLMSPKSGPCFASESFDDLVGQIQRHYGDMIDQVLFVEHPIEVVNGMINNTWPNRRVGIWQETDVLDTWFSSALWPFATLGWPDETVPLPFRGGVGVGSIGWHCANWRDPTPSPSPEGEGLKSESGPEGERESLLARHYPGDVLVSGFDILFFWDARMMMQGLHFMKQPPFKTLYLHGLVRAPDGQKMSKSKGNVIDPLGLIDQYGADALRFFMAAMESQGRDIKMDDARLEGYRNFATKLWNAARFCEANCIGASDTLAAPPAALPVNRWIIGEVVGCVAAMESALASLRFDDAANAIYQFAWKRFCDWYIELIKGQIDVETRAVAGWVLDQILVMLHPFMPFITEELWSAGGTRRNELIVARWPQPNANVDDEAAEDIWYAINIIDLVRSARTEAGIPPSAKINLQFSTNGPNVDPLLEWAMRILKTQREAIRRLARIESFSPLDAPNSANISFHLNGVNFRIPLEGAIDLPAERARLTKALEAAAKDRDALAARLANPAFTERAKPEAVEKAREDHAARAAEAERLSDTLARLG